MNLIKTGVGAIAVGTITTLLAAFLSEMSIKDVLTLMVSAICKFLLFRIPIWILLIIIFLVIISVILIKKRRHLPEWYHYVKMPYKDHLFTWEYSGREPVNIKELCMKCGCVINSSTCPYCNSSQKPIFSSVYYFQFISDLKCVIQLNIETGKYKEYIK
jgi:hypothetical protein